jgi:hypothetical protein
MGVQKSAQWLCGGFQKTCLSRVHAEKRLLKQRKKYLISEAMSIKITVRQKLYVFGDTWRSSSCNGQLLLLKKFA